MNLSRENSREFLQQAIDAEIKSLEESIRALRTRRNAISPISSLPPEVFAAIFSSVCLPASSKSRIGPNSNLYLDHRARLFVTHVCRQWREIALNQPLLWSHFDFPTASLTGVAEILARARMTPLYLYFEVPVSVCFAGYNINAQFDAFRKILQDHSSRLCHLHIRARPIYVGWTLETLVSPTLEFLSLSSEKDENRRPEQVSVPDTLFDGTTPRLSRLVLRNCRIGCKSPLLKGLRHLEMRTSSTVNARPKLAAWLDALDEIPQLQTLILHSASPIARSFPLDVKRTVTLPSLTYLDILASPRGCGLVLAHLILASLASLCVTAWTAAKGSGDLQKLLLYVARHAHGPHDTQPLQSALIRGNNKHLDIVAWPVPDIYDPLVLLAATLPPRVALSFAGDNWFPSDTYIEVLGAAMEVLPLGGLVTFTVQPRDFAGSVFLNKRFWLGHSPMWPLLQRVQLAAFGECEFTKMLLEDNGGRESPLLPSLTVLGLSEAYLSITGMLRDALMKRVEQGVPLETLDLRMCAASPVGVRLLSEIVVDVLGPETHRERERMIFRWDNVGRKRFAADVDYRKDYDDDEEGEEED